MRTLLAKAFAVFVLLLFLGALGWALTGWLRVALVAAGVLLLAAWLVRRMRSESIPR